MLHTIKGFTAILAIAGAVTIGTVRVASAAPVHVQRDTCQLHAGAYVCHGDWSHPLDRLTAIR